MRTEDALKFVKERRKIVDPNKGFMEQLELYEAEVEEL